MTVALDPDSAALHRDALYLDAAVPLVTPRLLSKYLPELRTGGVDAILTTVASLEDCRYAVARAGGLASPGPFGPVPDSPGDHRRRFSASQAGRRARRRSPLSGRQPDRGRSRSHRRLPRPRGPSVSTDLQRPELHRRRLSGRGERGAEHVRPEGGRDSSRSCRRDGIGSDWDRPFVADGDAVIPGRRVVGMNVHPASLNARIGHR